MSESGRCAFNEIVAEPLTEENHEVWFKCVRNYLIAHDLWGVVNEGGSARPPKHEQTWIRKNSAALHAIQISCSLESFHRIKKYTTAKDAWDNLNKIYNPPSPVLQVGPNTHEQVEYDALVLRKAIYDNKWHNARAILVRNPSVAVAKLDSHGFTSIHLAARFGRLRIVEVLMPLVPPNFLETRTNLDDTPLSCAAEGGIVRIAELLIRRSPTLTTLSHSFQLPVTRAFSRGHKEMGRYLYFLTPPDYLKPHNGPYGVNLLYWCFFARALDVALDLLKGCPELFFVKTQRGWDPISGIAGMATAFSGGRELVFWKRCVYKYINIPTTTTHPVDEDNQQEDKGYGLLHRLISNTCNILDSYIKEIRELKLVHAQATEILSLLCEKVTFLDNDKGKEKMLIKALHLAAKEGNVEFVVRVSKASPQLNFRVSSGLWNTFFFAIKHRQAEVFNLIHGIGVKDMIATQRGTFENNMLHLAGQLAPPSQLNRIAGPALQMQRELQWFKEVERVVPQGFNEIKNDDGMQPEDVFKDSHKELRKEGENWMKATASSCSVVAALVVTIMFATAFTIPGGNNQEFGYPIFLKENLFVVFIISDALSLFSSSTSVLMFLGILTSRYAEEDFLKSLPTKLIIGLSTLFLSIATMMAAFSACILLMLRHEYPWSFLPIIILASIPVTLFVLLQFPLLIQMVSSTYGRGIFKRNMKPWL